MGTAIVKMSPRLMHEALPLLHACGTVQHIDFPTYPGYYCRVYVKTEMVPEGEHDVVATIERERTPEFSRLTMRFEILDTKG